MSEQKPAYVFVGGVSHTPVFFEQLIEELTRHGYESKAVAWASCSEDIGNFKQQDDVDAIQNAVLGYLDHKSLDVVLVLHSYGGWPGSRAIKGLDKETRLENGKKTGIIEAVFISAFLLPDNAPMARYSNLPPWITVKDGSRKPNESAAPKLFSDLEPESQTYWLSQLVWQRNDFTGETVPDAPWHLPLRKTSVLCTEDRVVPLDTQFKMLQSVIDNTWTIKSINAGHEPFLSQPEKLARIILQPSL